MKEKNKRNNIRTQQQDLLPETFIYDLRYISDCDLDERRCLPIRYRCRYLCLNYKQCISEQDHNNFSCESLKTLVKLVDKRLTKNQKRVLKKIETTQKTTMTSLSNMLSEELNNSKITVRNILQILRDVGLINCGDVKNKGQLVSLTNIGKIIIERSKDKNKEKWR